MNNTETARLARAWAELVLTQEIITPEAVAAAEHIRATTDPLTMADVEWQDEEHHMAGATTHDGEEVAMIWPQTAVYLATTKGAWRRDQLTPNGKKYELREVGEPEQPEHPETLETLKDYANAPACTVVTEPGGFEWKKGYDGEWYSECQEGSWLTTRDMTDMGRQVLRWGEDGDTSEPTVSSNENVGPDQPEHPATLVTEQDYENVPEGTTVAEPGYTADRTDRSETMRKITIDLDTEKITNTGPLSPNEAATAGTNVTISAVLMQAEHYGWESAEEALTEVCDLMWKVFREERAEQENAQ